jgi:hypothetical protein
MQVFYHIGFFIFSKRPVYLRGAFETAKELWKLAIGPETIEADRANMTYRVYEQNKKDTLFRTH